MRITWLGHSTVLVELDGCRLLTDPVLGRRVAHLWRHSAPVAAVGHLDAVMISHAHHDHLDVRSLRSLAAGTRILAPAGSADVLRDKGFGHVDEVAVGDRVEVGPVELTTLPARHMVKRTPRGSASPAVGFKVAGSSSAVFFGDTDLFDGMSALGPTDVALLPVWGWGPKIGPGHLDPERAALAAQLLRARMAIPIHWGSFAPVVVGALRPGFLRRPGPEFARHVRRLTPDVDARVLSPGESVQVSVHTR